jgi:hypothetical protein
MSRPVPKKVPKKHYAQLKSNKKILVGFFGTFLGTGRDVATSRTPCASRSHLGLFFWTDDELEGVVCGECTAA